MDTLRNENDYVLNYIKLVDWKGNEYDFTNHYVEFTYEESIYSSPHGSMVVIDAVDYPTLLPIIGEERVKASFTRPDEKNPGTLLPNLAFDLSVYSMHSKQQDGASLKRQVYTLAYIAEPVHKNTSVRIFKAYKGKIYSDMVKEIYDTHISMGKPIEIEPTLHEMDYIINNERPYTAIKKINKRSISAEDNGSLYTFYEDRDSFHFVTFSKMFQRPVTTFIKYEPRNISTTAEGIARSITKVAQMQQGDTFDILSSALSGEGASHLLSINPIRRKMIEKDFDLKTEFDKFKHIDRHKRWSDKNKMFVTPKSNPKMIISNIGNDTAEYISSHEPGSKPFFYEEYKLHRNSQNLQILKQIVRVTLSGDPRVKAGDILEFALPEHLGKTSIDEPEQLDRYLQGKYLIAAVAHIIKPGSYMIHLELLKDTYNKELLNRNPIDEYDGKK